MFSDQFFLLVFLPTVLPVLSMLSVSAVTLRVQVLDDVPVCMEPPCKLFFKLSNCGMRSKAGVRADEINRDSFSLGRCASAIG